MTNPFFFFFYHYGILSYIKALHCALAPVPEHNLETDGERRHNSPLYEKKEPLYHIRPEVHLAWYSLPGRVYHAST